MKNDKQIAYLTFNEKQLVVLGAIFGDIIGSIYEGSAIKDINFSPLVHPRCHFTDDTVCTIAIADALISNKSFTSSLKSWCRKYHRVGYGWRFINWFRSEEDIISESFGNGSAMRVSGVGAIAKNAEEAIYLAKETARPSHSHPEGIKGAQATALAIFLAKNKKRKDEIADEIENKFSYNLHRPYSEIQIKYKFDVTCQGSVPEAIIAFLESLDYESAIRYAIALGGDTDTQAAIAGGIAAAYYGHIPQSIVDTCYPLLPDEMQAVIAKL